MRKITMLLALLVFIGIQVVNAQNRKITGTVTSTDDGSTLPGVSVVAKGTTIGTTTDINGKYQLEVSKDVTTLIYSFVGMKTQEITLGASNIIDVQLETETIDVSEVVVTAIGVPRTQKTIGYSATTVKSDEFGNKSQVAAMNALQGKVAGVAVTSGGGVPGASTKVIIRGYSSVTGSNNPLYVIDGTPIDNTSRTYGGLDFGNGANDINPNDIESMTILKGASATALYGPKGANGVIMITTKKAKAGEKLTVEYNGSFTGSDVLRLPQMQNVFGQGWSGHWADDENGSWGPKMDGKIRAWGNVVDGAQQIKPFAAVEDNLYDFYNYGKQYNNSVSVRGGNESSTFYLSYMNSSADGILPTDIDKNNKNILSFTGTTKGNKLSASTSLHYVRTDGSGVPDGWGGSNSAANVFTELLQIPRDFSIVDFKDYENNVYNNLDNFYTPYAFNPYYAINNNQSEFYQNRFYGNVSLDYEISDWLSAKYRVGVDASSFNRKDHEAIMRFTPGTPSYNKKVIENPGMVYEGTRNLTEINQDFLLNYKYQFNEDFNIDGILGFSSSMRNYKLLYGQINTLVIPGFYNLGNTDGDKEAATYETEKRQYGYYGTLNLGYKNFAFLTLSAREDYSSTLPKDKNSFFYPAANASFIISDIVPSIQTYIPFWKVRASWGKAGNDADPYLLNPIMASTEVWIPFSSLKFPINDVGAFEKGNVIGNPNLEPEITTETEIGTNIILLKNRLSFDVAYYKKISSGQILNVDIAPSSGFSQQVINFGDVENKGIELLATVVPVKTNNFEWTLTANYTKNHNEVTDLPGDATEIILAHAYGVEMVAIEGQPIGILRAPDFLRDDAGNIIVNSSTGIPQATTENTVVGNIQADYILGITNSLKYKNFNFSFNFDYRKGGMFYSGTADLHYFVGNATKTVFNDRQPFLLPNSVKENPAYDPTDANSPEYIENDVPIDMNNNNAYYYHSSNLVANRDRVLSRDYLKLRDVTLTYSIPKTFLKNKYISDASIILSGRNLLLWTPEDNNFVDPESTSFGNDLTGDFGEFRTGPTVRSFTVGLKLKF